MNKTIFLATLFGISSLTAGNNVPREKYAELKKKHSAEREQAIHDLKIAGAAALAAAVVFGGIHYFFETCDYKNKLVRHIGHLDTSISIFGSLTVDACIGLCAIYKGFIGTKHLVFPNHPNPEENQSKNRNHS